MTKKLAVYLLFLACLTVGLYMGMESFLSTHPKPTIIKQTTVVKKKPTLTISKLMTQPILRHASQMKASPEGNEIAAITGSNTLTVVDAQTGRVVSKTSVSGNISSLDWVSDRLLFVMSSHNVLYSYDVFAQRLRLIHSFLSGLTFECITFSSYTNDLFVVFTSQNQNVIYQFDTNEHYYTRSLGTLPIRNAFYTSTNFTLYYVDSAHTLYQLKNGYVEKLRQNVAILRGAGNVLYYAILDHQNHVSSVARYGDQGNSVLLCRLKHPAELGQLVIDHAGTVFLTTPTELYDVTHGKYWAIPRGFTLKIAGSTILLTHGSKYRVVVD